MSEHEWVVRIAKDGRVIAECIKIDCDAQLDPYDIDNNLNEHAALKRENDGLLGIVSAYHPEYLRGCDCPQCSDALLKEPE